MENQACVSVVFVCSTETHWICRLMCGLRSTVDRLCHCQADTIDYWWLLYVYFRILYTRVYIYIHMWFMICCNLVGMDYMICVSIHINDEIEYIYIYIFRDLYVQVLTYVHLCDRAWFSLYWSCEWLIGCLSDWSTVSSNDGLMNESQSSAQLALANLSDQMLVLTKIELRIAKMKLQRFPVVNCQAAPSAHGVFVAARFSPVYT